MDKSTNSKVSRVQPMFGWLSTHGGNDWATRLISLAQGMSAAFDCGPVVQIRLDPEAKVPASPSRLAWMIRNVAALAPSDGRQWLSLRERVADKGVAATTLQNLDSGKCAGMDKKLRLEGSTCADCLIECEHAFIWIEGKRNDWISPSIQWDVTRDQLARNVEAAWLLARAKRKEYCVLICHEDPLKHHETSLVAGYRAGTWSAGWPHIEEAQRREFAGRIGTVTWSEIAAEWPRLREVAELADLKRAE
jgi:hypothetical protein